MQKIKLDKHSLNENELDHVLIRIKDFVMERPKEVIIPVAVTVLVILGVTFGMKYFSSESQKADLALLQAQNIYKNALASKDKGSQIIALSQAQEQFKKVANDHSMSMFGKTARVYIGDCLYHSGKYDEAIKAYQNAISGGAPDVAAASAQLSIGFCYMNKKDYKSSQSEFEKVITRYPESHLVPMAKMEMAVAYENSNDFAKAKEIYEGIIKVYPDSTWNQEAQARLIALSGMAQTAVKK